VSCSTLRIARAALDTALAADAHPVTLTVRPRRLDLLVRDHRVVIEIRGGVLRVIWVGAPLGGGPATRERRVPLDDADEAVVGDIVRGAVEEG
jgi:hypothetical protein